MTRLVSPLTDLALSIDRLLTATPPEAAPLGEIAVELGRLLADDGWLAEENRRCDPATYRRIRLYEDAAGRFSIGCFVWGAGQASPIHDHNSWGVVGVLNGPIRSEGFRLDEAGALHPDGAAVWYPQGAIGFADPTVGDIHRLSAPADRQAISIHVYGCRFDEVNRNRYPEPAISAAA